MRESGIDEKYACTGIVEVRDSWRYVKLGGTGKCEVKESWWYLKSGGTGKIEYVKVRGT